MRILRRKRSANPAEDGDISEGEIGIGQPVYRPSEGKIDLWDTLVKQGRLPRPIAMTSTPEAQLKVHKIVADAAGVTYEDTFMHGPDKSDIDFANIANTVCGAFFQGPGHSAPVTADRVRDVWMGDFNELHPVEAMIQRELLKAGYTIQKK